MIWLELRITQGHAFSTEDEHETSEVIEDAIDTPARNIFFESESHFAWCYILAEGGPRVSVNRLNFIQSELQRAFRDEVGRSLDEINVIDPSEIERHVPEAVQRGPSFEG